MTQIIDVEDGDLAVEAIRDGSQIIAKVAGTADPAGPFAFALQAIHAARAGIAEVIFDVSKADLVSADCINALLSWISEIQGLPEHERYKVRFVASAERTWQKKSLHAVRCFASELVTIVELPT